MTATAVGVNRTRTGFNLWMGALFLGLNLVGRHLYRTERKAVAVAFFLAGVSLLPLFLLIALHEATLLAAAPGATNQLFTDGSISNHQLQLTVAIACAWSGWLALETRTAALSTVFSSVKLTSCWDIEVISSTRAGCAHAHKDIFISLTSGAQAQWSWARLGYCPCA